ncbi:MAG: BLUF domain-containing protein, partial [Gammaproteobacteria bacterium]
MGAPAANDPGGPDGALFHLGYVSTQTGPFGTADLLQLLAAARRRNQARNVTGLLIHRDDSFFQVLEGREEDVRRIFGIICEDPAHQRINVLFEEPLAEREFADWRMAFVELDNVDVRMLPGYSSFLVDEAEPRRFLEELTR